MEGDPSLSRLVHFQTFVSRLRDEGHVSRNVTVAALGPVEDGMLCLSLPVMFFAYLFQIFILRLVASPDPLLKSPFKHTIALSFPL